MTAVRTTGPLEFYLHAAEQTFILALPVGRNSRVGFTGGRGAEELPLGPAHPLVITGRVGGDRELPILYVEDVELQTRSKGADCRDSQD